MDAGPASVSSVANASLSKQPAAAAAAAAAATSTKPAKRAKVNKPAAMSIDGDDQMGDDDDNQDEERRIQNGHYDRADPPKPCEIIHNELTLALANANPKPGVLVPQKTTLEVHQNHASLNVWITRVPAKCTNSTLQ